MTEAIKIQGLREFQKSLKKLDKDLPKALRIAFNEAADSVAADARRRVPKRSGRAAGSIRSRSTQVSVRITEGGSRAPYMPWLDFGGRVGRKRRVQRTFLKDGRYLYASYFKRRDSGEFQEDLQKALIKVATEAGLEVERG